MLQMSPGRRVAWKDRWKETLIKNRAWEQQLHSIYGVETTFSATPDTTTCSETSTRVSSPTPRCGRSGATSPVGDIKSLREDVEEAFFDYAMPGASISWREQMDMFPSMLDSYPLADPSEIGWVEPADEESEMTAVENIAAQRSRARSPHWDMSSRAAVRIDPVSGKRARPSYWLPFSRHNGGRYANSPDWTGAIAKKDDLLQMPYGDVMTNDGRGMRVRTPEGRFSPTQAIRFKAWVQCTCRP